MVGETVVTVVKLLDASPGGAMEREREEQTWRL